MTALADRDCVPCRGGVPPLGEAEIAPLLAQLAGWTMWRAGADHPHPKSPLHGALRTRYTVANFAEALALVNRIGAIAEAQNHHPDLGLAWGRVDVEIWTHTIRGLTESDFIFAAKCDRAYAALRAARGEPLPGA
jgi:4a-hydroxytetrahydrobiopterin dehydratase